MLRRAPIVVLILAASFLPWLASATPAFACSCMETKLADFIGQRDRIIFVGRGIEASGDEMRPNVRVRVQAWFQGPGVAPEIMTQGGNGADCGLTITPGTTWFVATWVPQAGEPVRPSICGLAARIDSEQGQALLAETIRLVGPGASVPGTAPPEPTAPSVTVPADTVAIGGHLATAILAASVLAGCTLLGAVWLIGQRRIR